MAVAARLDDATSFLFGAWRARPFGKRMVTAIALLMALSGLVMIFWPAITDLYTARQQDLLADQFASPDLVSKFRAGTVEDGQVLTRIVIEKLGVDSLVVEGTDPKALRAGAGHYKNTAMPCRPGNVSIAGHRTTYGKPFHRLDELKAGDSVVLVTPTGRCEYEVVNADEGLKRVRPSSAGWITHPNDGLVISPLKGSFLTLTTCHPKGSAKERLILRAKLVKG